jgi:hypothetical protein
MWLVLVVIGFILGVVLGPGTEQQTPEQRRCCSLAGSYSVASGS